MILAKCRGKTTSPETDYWYPDPEEPEDIQKSKTAIAKAICSTCIVQKECLAYAILNHETYGIWAGKTTRERSMLRNRLY